MPSAKNRSRFRAMGSFFLAMAAIPLLVSYSFGGSGTLTVSGTQLRVTSQYLGANEGSSQFNINDLVDLGINTYRIYGGMSRWEPTNAESTYGSPTIAQIEADPNVINWAFFDNIFTNPPAGSDYSWSASTGIPPVNAATIISDLNAHNLTPIIVLRNRDNNGNPSWSPNPPVTAADWNVCLNMSSRPCLGSTCETVMWWTIGNFTTSQITQVKAGVVRKPST